MKALRFDSSGLKVSEVEKPAENDEALVRVTLSGICNTDLEIISGYAGFAGTIGHEFVGVVESALDRPEIVGKRVVGEINAGCGMCVRCLSGDSRHCPKRTVLGIHGRDGSHAEYLLLPSRNLLEVPSSVPCEEAVFVEPLAAAYGITEQVEIVSETRVAVIGDGKLGILCALSLGLGSSDVTLVGKHPEKLKIVEDQGIRAILRDKVSEKVFNTFDVVVEASGSGSGLELAMDIVRPRGKIVLKSTFHGAATWPASRVVVDEISIVGSRCGRFGPVLDLLAKRSIDVRPLVSDEFRLDDAIQAIEKAGTKGILKVLLRP